MVNGLRLIRLERFDGVLRISQLVYPAPKVTQAARLVGTTI
jgi:hypothetical protein